MPPTRIPYPLPLRQTRLDDSRSYARVHAAIVRLSTRELEILEDGRLVMARGAVPCADVVARVRDSAVDPTPDLADDTISLKAMIAGPLATRIVSPSGEQLGVLVERTGERSVPPPRTRLVSVMDTDTDALLYVNSGFSSFFAPPTTPPQDVGPETLILAHGPTPGASVWLECCGSVFLVRRRYMIVDRRRLSIQVADDFSDVASYFAALRATVSRSTPSLQSRFMPPGGAAALKRTSLIDRARAASRWAGVAGHHDTTKVGNDRTVGRAG